MTAGLPGIGIGGIFYLVCACLMPVKEIINTLRGKTSKKRWALVGRQLGLVAAIMAGFWLTGRLMGITLAKVSARVGKGVPIQAHNIFRIQPLVLSLVTLSFVIVSVGVCNWYLDRKPRRKSSPKHTRPAV